MTTASTNGDEPKTDRATDPLPGQPTEHPVWQLLQSYCQPQLHYIGTGALAMLVARLLWLFPPVLVGVAFDSLLMGSAPYRLPLVPAAWVPASQSGQLWFTAGLLAVGYFGGSLCYLLGSWIRHIAAYRIQHRLRTDSYDAVQNQALGFFEHQQTGELLSILNNDVNQLEEFLTDTLTRAVNSVAIVFVLALYMLVLHWQLALLSFLVFAGGAVVNYYYSRHVQAKHQQRRQDVGDINTRIENNLAGIDCIKLSTRGDDEKRRVATRSARYKHLSWLIARAQVLFGQVTGQLKNVGYLLVFLVGGYWILQGPPLVFSGELRAGTLLTFLLFVTQFSFPMQQFTPVVDSYQETRAAGARVLGLLAVNRSLPAPSDAVVPDDIEGRVDYEDVTFAYRGAAEPALQNIDIAVEPGEMVGVVGPTGAGKSTLVKLLLRFYDVDDGSVCVDGFDVRTLSVEALRENLGYVGQEPFLFDGTVRKNIAYSNPDATDEAVRAAAQRAGAHGFITDLADRYETEVGERGVQLSGGQRQRISIARAVLADPRILVLDEATSHVDTETEAVIQRRLADIVADRTTFVIAHRLSTVRDADTILVVKDGRIVERGNHHQLLDADGLYATLWNVQVGETASVSDEAFQRVASDTGD